MRNIRLVGGLAAAVCVLAVGAAPAMAHQFVASKTGKTSGKGYEEIFVEKGEVSPPVEPEHMQEWKFGTAFRILCYKANGAGEVTEGASETFSTTTKYSKCGWYPQKNTLHTAASFSKTGITVIYHANGYTEAVGNGEGEEYEFKKAEVLETAAYIKINASHLCKIIIPAQTIPVTAIKHPTEEFSSAVYSNIETPSTNLKLFPSGFQKRIVIANEFKKLKYKYAGEGETQCSAAPEFETLSEEGGGGSNGFYKGALEEQLKGGNLSFE